MEKENRYWINDTQLNALLGKSQLPECGVDAVNPELVAEIVRTQTI
jgi:hypothetical protein